MAVGGIYVDHRDHSTLPEVFDLESGLYLAANVVSKAERAAWSTMHEVPNLLNEILHYPLHPA